MSNKVSVWVVDIGRRYLVLRWNDPETGARRQKSTGTKNLQKAQRIAGQIEAELNAGVEVNPARVPWEHLRERFEDEKYPLIAKRSGYTYDAVFNAVERILNPRYVSDITATRLARFQSELLKSKLRLASVQSYLKHLRSVLNWAKDHNLLTTVPKFRIPKLPKGSKLMRGRPISEEEFQQMLDVVPEVVGEENSAAWLFYLRGIWTSGLRLSESLEVYWDRPDKHQVILDGQYPMLRVLAELEKGRRNRIVPITPEFAELLNQVPLEERTGPVFFPISAGPRFLADWYSRLACRIGKKAHIVVDTEPNTGKVKYAGLHDLRRAFGQRWAQRVLPQHLMQLMRHESIETTLNYYVGDDAELTAQAIWKQPADEACDENSHPINGHNGARNRIAG